MNEWIILLLPFLAIGVGGVLAGLIALRSNRRRMSRTRPVLPHPEPELLVEPLRERPVDTPHRRG